MEKKCFWIESRKEEHQCNDGTRTLASAPNPHLIVWMTFDGIHNLFSFSPSHADVR